MADELDEMALESQLDTLARNIATGEVEPEPKPAEPAAELVEEFEEEAAPVVEDDAEEARARADGHVSYDEWVQSGKDPRAWRPAAEYNRRGDMLKTPKPELIDKVESLLKMQEKQLELARESHRIAQEEKQAAYLRGKQEAIEQARQDQEQAFAVGDRKAHQEALQREQEAVADIQATQQRQPAAVDPELVAWQEGAKWFTEGFDANNQPKTPEVEAFMDYQRSFMLANPSAKVVDSVKFAEAKVKRLMPDAFKPKTPRATAPAVDTAPRVARSGADPLAKYSVAERQVIREAAKAFGKSTTEYLKMIEG